jgi:ubiquinone/menaquinone biosynthesis C-methylase UbiE
MTQSRYDQVADFYVAGWQAVDDPASVALLDLLGPPGGLSILDLACGHGRTARELASHGAIVVGADISAALLERARRAEREEPLGIRYLRADAAALPLGDAGFDAVTCNFGLSDIDELDDTLAGVGRALRPGGMFVFCILHPCFPGGPEVSGSWPAAGRYYDELRWTASGALSPLRAQVGANHRTLATYLNALRRHGFWLDVLSEPPPTQEWSMSRGDADRHPVFLAARCVRSPRLPPQSSAFAQTQNSLPSGSVMTT